VLVEETPPSPSPHSFLLECVLQLVERARVAAPHIYVSCL